MKSAIFIFVGFFTCFCFSCTSETNRQIHTVTAPNDSIYYHNEDTLHKHPFLVVGTLKGRKIYALLDTTWYEDYAVVVQSDFVVDTVFVDKDSNVEQIAYPFIIEESFTFYNCGKAVQSHVFIVPQIETTLSDSTVILANKFHIIVLDLTQGNKCAVWQIRGGHMQDEFVQIYDTDGNELYRLHNKYGKNNPVVDNKIMKLCEIEQDLYYNFEPTIEKYPNRPLCHLFHVYL